MKLKQVTIQTNKKWNEILLIHTLLLHQFEVRWAQRDSSLIAFKSHAQHFLFGLCAHFSYRIYSNGGESSWTRLLPYSFVQMIPVFKEMFVFYIGRTTFNHVDFNGRILLWTIDRRKTGIQRQHQIRIPFTVLFPRCTSLRVLNEKNFSYTQAQYLSVC